MAPGRHDSTPRSRTTGDRRQAMRTRRALASGRPTPVPWRPEGDTMTAAAMLVFGGSGSPRLTRRICEHLQVVPGAGEVLRFSEGNLFVRVKENVRGRHVYIVQSTVFPANDHFMELLFWIDALKRASAESVTVVLPYFSYAKGDKKDEPRVSIRARVC